MIRLTQCLLLLAVAGGCAIAPSARVVRAQVEIDAATSAGADQYAIYDITKAREYVHKAREELGYAEYQTAMHYADAAVECGERAKELSREHPIEQAALPAQVAPRQPPPVIVPASAP